MAVTSFWQLARHWNQGDKAKLELSCEDGNLHMQLSAVLGHPDQPHFPRPPPPQAPFPPPKKTKSPSQLRRQERRQREALAKAFSPTNITEESDEVLTENVVEGENETPAVKVVGSPVKDSYLIFKCDQCTYTNATDKGLSQHVRMKHRISQVDGNIDLEEEDSKEVNVTTRKLSDDDNLEKNETSTNSEDTDLLMCDKCDHRANCEVSLRKHKSKAHTKPVTHERFKCNICGENLDTKNCQTNHMICQHNHPGEVLSCDICEFMTSREVCLNMHVSKRHKDIDEKELYHYAEAYWEKDHMGTSYKTFADALDNIKTSNLSLEDKELESERVKDARMNAYLENGWKMWEVKRSLPPWSS